MKMSFLLLLFLLTPSAPAKAGYMGECDGYIILASIIGGVCTGASCLLWYFHQKVLKEDFFKKEENLQLRIIRLERELGAGNENIRMVDPVMVLAPDELFLPHVLDVSQEHGTPPPAFDEAWTFPEEFLRHMSQNHQDVVGRRIGRANNGQQFVGSLFLGSPTGSVSPVIMETAFSGAEEA